MIKMTTLREDTKDIAISIGYDFLLVALLLCWLGAIILALVEVSLWVVFGVFLVGCGIFFAMLYIGSKAESKEKKEKVQTSSTVKE